MFTDYGQNILIISSLDYEEDFEADDEGPVEDGAEERNETPSLTREEEEETGNKDENKNEVTEQSQDSDSEAEDSDKNSQCFSIL